MVMPNRDAKLGDAAGAGAAEGRRARLPPARLLPHRAMVSSGPGRTVEKAIAERHRRVDSRCH
jgi:hypothetical protein